LTLITKYKKTDMKKQLAQSVERIVTDLYIKRSIRTDIFSSAGGVWICADIQPSCITKIRHWQGFHSCYHGI